MEEARPKDKKAAKSLARAAGESGGKEKLVESYHALGEILPPPLKRRKEAEASISGLGSEEEAPSRGRYTLEERLDFLTEAVFDIRRRMDVETKERAVEDDAPSKGT